MKVKETEFRIVIKAVREAIILVKADTSKNAISIAKDHWHNTIGIPIVDSLTEAQK